VTSRPPHDEHWLDRLALAQTRGQFLKGVLAAAALTLPFARPSLARGAAETRTDGCKVGLTNDPTACRRGCIATSHRRYEAIDSACKAPVATASITGLYGFVYGPLLYVGSAALSSIASVACHNKVLVETRNMQADCGKPDCGGFDPCAAYGPCDTCPAYCNPCPTSPDGYNCCTQPMKDGWTPCCVKK